MHLVPHPRDVLHVIRHHFPHEETRFPELNLCGEDRRKCYFAEAGPRIYEDDPAVLSQETYVFSDVEGALPAHTALVL